ncbi:MAG: protein kinase [Anaerolineae bacterium]|nr:protein kinase [Anaerolineae bacterium]
MTGFELEQLADRRLGQYELRSLIGTGGMSAVYRAYQPTLSREVAIKVLATDLAADPDYQHRFALEARTAAGLEHTHIVPVYDYGAEAGLIYVVMRLLTGGTLAQRLALARHDQHPLPSSADVVSLLDMLASAMDYAHERGVIHRDIKPSNIMFDPRGTPYLVDFGIARILNSNLELTAAGTTIGTPNYMAPEQWRDEPVTAAVDQYALGVLIFNTLTGNLPFSATTSHALMYKHLNDPPPAVHDLRDSLPEALTPVLQKALAKTPGARYPSIMAFARAFRTAVQEASADTTDFFTFPLPASSPTADDPTPASAARVDAPGSVAQRVSLAAPPPGATMPSSLPEALASGYTAPAAIPDSLPQDHTARETFESGPTMPGSLPAMPDLDDLGQTMPGATYQPSPATQRGQPPVQQPAARHDRTPPPAARSRTAEQRSGGIPLHVIVALVISAILLVVLFVVIIRTINSQQLEGSVPVETPAAEQMEIAAGENEPAPTLLPLPEPVSLAPAGARITPDNAAALAAAGRPFSGSNTSVRMVAFSRGGMLAAAHGDGLVRLWRDGVEGGATTLTGHQGVVYTLTFSPDGSLLASGGEDSAIRLWETASGSLRGTLRGHNGLVRGLAFSPDGQRLVSAGEDGNVYLWDISSETRILNFKAAEGRALDVAFSPDGQVIATADNANFVRLWDAGGGQALRTLRGHTEAVRSVAYSPDGTLIASSSTDDTIRIWDAASGTTRHTLTGHGRDVWFTAFSPDSALLASGGRDNNLRVWDVATGEELTTLTGHTGWVLGVDFSADGSTIATASGDGSVRLWRLAP